MNKKVLAVALILITLLSLGTVALGAEVVPSSSKTVIVTELSHAEASPGDPVPALESFNKIVKLMSSGKSAGGYYAEDGNKESDDVDQKTLVESIAKNVAGLSASTLRSGITAGAMSSTNAGTSLTVKVGIDNAQGVFTWYTVTVKVDSMGNIKVPFTSAMAEQAVGGNGSVLFHIWK